MSDSAETFPVLRVTDGEKAQIEDTLVKESPLTIFLNGEELVTLLCTPTKQDYLAVGFLYAEGLIQNREEIEKVVLNEQRGVVWVQSRENKDLNSGLMFKRFITSGCGRGATFYNPLDATGLAQVKSEVRVSAPEILALAQKLQHQSELYRATGGVHSAALCNRKEILIFAEDIGRHNAIDKIFGQCIMNDIDTDDKIMLTSGRISSEILLKATRKGVPIVVSKSAPTDLAVKLASELGVTAIGFVRGKRMNIYANEWRISDQALMPNEEGEDVGTNRQRC